MRKLTNNERAQVLEYIQKDPEMNLFIFGDIENFGLDSDTVEIFVYEKQGKWDFLLLRYLDCYILYSQNNHYDVKTAAEFLFVRNAHIISGKSELVEKLLPYFPKMHGQNTYMARLNSVQFVSEPPPEFELRRLTPDNAADIVALYSQIEEFSSNYVGREEKEIEAIKLNLSKSGRGWGAFRNGKLTAAASSSADNSISAMIVGVATLPEARKMGLASGLVSKLCAELLGEGKQFLCLFYDNPAAGSIYRKIGFHEVGGYMMIKNNT